jgi:hypothetical protein
MLSKHVVNEFSLAGDDVLARGLPEHNAAEGRREVGRLMGIEPTTTGITIRDSTTELQSPLEEVGAPDRTRTCDPRLRRPML